MDGSSNFDDLFAHQDWVRSLAVRLCADADAADDLVQDTWTLAPGAYELRQVVDDEIVRTQPLIVGSEPVMVELSPIE